MKLTRENFVKTKGIYKPKAILVEIDEMGEIMSGSNYKLVSSIQESIGSIARLGRAAGVHLCLATQRPSSNVINADLKNNIQQGVILGEFDSSASSLIFDEDVSNLSKPEIKGRGFVKSGKDIAEFQSYWTDPKKDFVYVETKEEPKKNIDVNNDSNNRNNNRGGPIGRGGPGRSNDRFGGSSRGRERSGGASRFNSSSSGSSNDSGAPQMSDEEFERRRAERRKRLEARRLEEEKREKEASRINNNGDNSIDVGNRQDSVSKNSNNQNLDLKPDSDNKHEEEHKIESMHNDNDNNGVNSDIVNKGNNGINNESKSEQSIPNQNILGGLNDSNNSNNNVTTASQPKENEKEKENTLMSQNLFNIKEGNNDIKEEYVNNKGNNIKNENKEEEKEKIENKPLKLKVNRNNSTVKNSNNTNNGNIATTKKLHLNIKNSKQNNKSKQQDELQNTQHVRKIKLNVGNSNNNNGISDDSNNSSNIDNNINGSIDIVEFNIVGNGSDYSEINDEYNKNNGNN